MNNAAEKINESEELHISGLTPKVVEVKPPCTISWSAVIAASVLSLVIALTLGLLGTAIGTALIDIPSREGLVATVGIFSGIWYVLTSLACLFVGGFIAARLSGQHDTFSAVVHGLLTWSILTFLTVYTVTSGIGLGVSTAMSALSRSGQMIAGMGLMSDTNLNSTIANRLDTVNLSVSEITRELQEILNETGKEALTTESLTQKGNKVMDSAESSVSSALQKPSQISGELSSLIEQLRAHAETVLSAADEQAAVNVLMNNTTLSESEARQVIRRWSAKLTSVYSELNDAKQYIGQRSEKLLQSAVDASSSAAFWTFISLVAGAIAATIGAYLGSGSQYGSIVRVYNRKDT